MTEYRQNTDSFSQSSPLNALDFFVESKIKKTINTAIPVRVDSITRPGESGGAGYLSATPLIEGRDASGNAIANVSIPKLRWFRYQHGTAAIICDPKPGDIGLAVFAQQDVSALTGGTDPVQPGSLRSYDLSDGFYIGGYWGQTPTTFIRIEDTGDITVTAPQTHTTKSPQVTINCDTCQVNASSSVTLQTPATHATGTLTVDGLITGKGGLAISGGSGASVQGSLTTTGDVTAAGISLDTHTHSGVQPGGGNTGGPQ